MPLFRKKPVQVEAFLWTRNGDHPLDYVLAIEDEENTWSAEWQRTHNWEGQLIRYYRDPDRPGFQIHEMCGQIWNDHGWIDTGRYGHTVCPGDWIVQDAVGEFYPVRPDVFVKTYEPL